MPVPHAKQIAVIGAGPAGSVAAIRLARLGHRVTLFEKATFPRDKVCGECLSATGIDVLRRLEVAERMQAALEPARLRRASAVAADGSSTSVDLPDEMWGLTRRAMDAWLAATAADAGVDVQFSRQATIGLRGTGIPPVIHLNPLHERDASATTSQVFDHVILADGSGRAMGPMRPTGDFGIKAHFRGVDAPPETIELVALSAGYAGLAPVNDGLWNAAWSVPAASLKRFGGDIEGLFQHEVGRSATLRRRFGRTSRVGDWLACPLPRYAVRRRWPTAVIPIGNAAAALEPVGGEGMGLAMRSAELAADAIDAAARQGRAVDVDQLHGAFDRLWRHRRAACRTGAVALSHSFFGPLTIGIAKRAPALARIGMAFVGK